MGFARRRMPSDTPEAIRQAAEHSAAAMRAVSGQRQSPALTALRYETKPYVVRLFRSPALRALDFQISTRPAYLALLRRLYGFFLPFDRTILHTLGADHAGLFLVQRQKSHLLLQDLLALGETLMGLQSLPLCTAGIAETRPADAGQGDSGHWDSGHWDSGQGDSGQGDSGQGDSSRGKLNIFHALGALYGAEALMLRGQSQAAALGDALNLSPPDGLRFLHNYDNASASMWRGLTATIARDAVGPVAVSDLLSGATGTLTVLHGWLDGEWPQHGATARSATARGAADYPLAG